MKVEIRHRWLFLYASLAVAFLLKDDPVLLIAYVSLVVIGSAIGLLLGPKKLRAAEHAFRSESLALLSKRQFDGLEALAAKQYLLRWFGPGHVLPETKGMAAAGRCEYNRAVSHFQTALAQAQDEHLNRIQTNLARALVQAEQLPAAEVAYRAILERDEQYPLALAGLGTVLMQQGRDYDAAASYLRSALTGGIARNVEVHLALAELAIRTGSPDKAQVLEDARRAGADEDALRALASLEVT